VADGLVFLAQCLANQRGRRALVGIEVPDVATIEPDGEFVLQDEVDANVLADAVRAQEGSSNTPCEDVEPARLTRECVEREVGVERRLVTEDDELAHVLWFACGGLNASVGRRATTGRALWPPS